MTLHTVTENINSYSKTDSKLSKIILKIKWSSNGKKFIYIYSML